MLVKGSPGAVKCQSLNLANFGRKQVVLGPVGRVGDADNSAQPKVIALWQFPIAGVVGGLFICAISETVHYYQRGQVLPAGGVRR